MDLKAALLQERVASSEEYELAAARQVLFGGDLITNLLELSGVDEARAQRALCRAYSLGAAPLGELPRTSEAAAAALPAHLAQRHGVYPLHVEGRVLTLVASEPLTPETLLALRGTTDLQLEVLIALDIRVKQAFSRDARQTLSPALRRALARLEHGAKPNQSATSSLPPSPWLESPSFSVLPKAPSITPLPFPKLWAQAETPTEAQLAAETAPVAARLQTSRPPPVGSRLSVPAPPGFATSPASGVEVVSERSPRSRRRGPYTAAEAQHDLKGARSPDDIVQVFSDYAAQYFDYTAVFSFHTHTAQLRAVRGMRDPAEPSERALPLTDHPALRRASEEPRWRLAALAQEDPNLARLLDQIGPEQALFLPIRVRDRVALLLLGGFYSGAVELSEIGELFAFEPLVALALERAILLRKTNPELAAPSYTPFPHPRFSSPPSARGSEALVKALHKSAVVPSEPPAATPAARGSQSGRDPDAR